MNHNVLLIALGILLKSVYCDVIVYARQSSQMMEEFRDLPARFGPKLSSPGTRYLFKGANPRDACSNIQPKESNEKVAVIIARYNCSFEEKVRAAQKANYDAVIVYNINSNELEQMSAKNEDGIYIPSVFVGELTGRVLLENYYESSEYAIIINDGLPFDINTHLIIPFSVVVGLCFVTMLGFMIIKCVREQRRLRRYRLPSAMLKKIPTIKYAKGDNYDLCAICLDDYIEGDKLRVLPCSHAYHTKCIDPWLTKNRRVCPICKRKVFARGERRHRRRRSSSDSMSDSNTDDRTPLLNPVENSANHGTFPNLHDGNSSNESIDSQSPPYQPAPRINPFDRVVPQTTSQNDNEQNTLSRWEKFKRMFSSRSTELEVEVEPPISVIVNPNSITSATPANVQIPPRSSNNLLNTNLSGSFKDSDDFADNNNDNDSNINEIEPSSSSTLQRGRLGVAAIPNNNFNTIPSRNSNNDTHII